MPEKSLNVATYAAGASLAAITLFYVFGPTYFLDGDPTGSGSPLSGISNRKKGVVGLTNAANDCFINSVLQALAGLGDLRLYLIRETHRRKLDDTSIYTRAVPDDVEDTNVADARSQKRSLPMWKIEGLQAGLVTKGLKEILDQLNERPIYKKTISAVTFVRVLEVAFRQRISRQQQDAQEFLQVVAERLCDEYHAGCKARKYARDRYSSAMAPPIEGLSGNSLHSSRTDEMEHPQVVAEEEEGFPFEGKISSQIECLTCGFKPRLSEQTFCTLTLNVPQVSSTTLSACFDSMFKTEYIDDFRCERCRLVHAKRTLEANLTRTSSESSKTSVIEAINKLDAAILSDPESPPDDVELPDARFAPKSRIAKHVRITQFPKIIAIHLSRSIYDSSQSLKNSAKVAFPEQLPLGGMLEQRQYKLLGLVTHKGSHHSGHYESFRRQNLYPPYSNPHTFQPSGAYTPTASPVATPRLSASRKESPLSSPCASTPDLLSDTITAADRYSGLANPAARAVHSKVGSTVASRNSGKDQDIETSSLRSVARSTLSRISLPSRSGSRCGSRDGQACEAESSSKAVGPPQAARTTNLKPKRRKQHGRWWRISDEKVKEASTRDVLGMQREVYLLFYEMERQT